MGRTWRVSTSNVVLVWSFGPNAYAVNKHTISMLVAGEGSDPQTIMPFRSGKINIVNDDLERYETRCVLD